MDPFVGGYLITMAFAALLVFLGFAAQVIEVRRLGLLLSMLATIIMIVQLVSINPADAQPGAQIAILVAVILFSASGMKKDRPWRKSVPFVPQYPTQTSTTALVGEQVTEGR